MFDSKQSVPEFDSGKPGNGTLAFTGYSLLRALRQSRETLPDAFGLQARDGSPAALLSWEIGPEIASRLGVEGFQGMERRMPRFRDLDNEDLRSEAEAALGSWRALPGARLIDASIGGLSIFREFGRSNPLSTALDTLCTSRSKKAIVDLMAARRNARIPSGSEEPAQGSNVVRLVPEPSVLDALRAIRQRREQSAPMRGPDHDDMRMPDGGYDFSI